MDQAPLVIDELEAGVEFIRRLNAYQRVAAACWLRPDEDSDRYLHVAIDGLTDDKMDAAYADVGRVADEMTDHYIDRFRVKVNSTNDRIAKAVLDIYRRYRAPIPTRFKSSDFGGTAVDEVYVYPPLRAQP